MDVKEEEILVTKLGMRPLHRLVYIALLAAIGMMCMLCFGFKLIPAASYLKYDPNGAVILLCGLLLGPVAGLECAVVKGVLYFLVHGGSPYGHISEFLATATLMLVAVCLAHRFRAGGKKRILCCAAGVLAATIIMIPANYVILYLQHGMSAEAVTASMVYVIPFNLLKAALNSAIALCLYAPVYRALGRILKIGE
ncbi:ECF transporter S component [uncultured Dysosmobacter sp.]|uniref:ECF transporter S component n=1 Tax=uncultured Dysosmobacter sp. TaxID=2591384 RepID=UPI0026108F6B|nr:ECF transporter S component [uncultured Dysosmobacter sp.]